MIERLKVNGYLSLVDADIRFRPLTVLLGRNGAGKSALLDALERLGSYARGGAERAFGPPPYSLGDLRSRGYGDIPATSFEAELSLDAERYRYKLALAERNGQAQVEEERLMLASGQVVAAWSSKTQPTSGTILRPDTPNPIIERVAAHLKSVRIFDLDPRSIEQPSEDRESVLGRDGYGVGAYLGKLQEEDLARFADIEERVRQLRPGTKGLRVWGGGAGRLYWGIQDQRGEDWRCPAPLLSWGDRMLVGILCVLFAAEAGSVVGLEEIERGFHPSRYQAVVDLLSEAAYKGMGGRGPIQIIATSHSPALVSRFQDRLDELRLVSRAAGGTTTVTPMDEEVQRGLGEVRTGAPIGEVWAMGLLDLD
jgi:predicted ATPase